MDIEPETVVQTLNVDLNIECNTFNKNEESLKLLGQLILKLVKLSNMLVIACLYISSSICIIIVLL